MKPETNFLRLPHFFLFQDLFYSHLEAKKILKDIADGQASFPQERVTSLAKHYLLLFEVLEFLHEYTPDFFVINKIQDTEGEIICFANEEFAKTFGLKSNPEGHDIFALMSKNEQQNFRAFVDEEVKKAKEKLQASSAGNIDVAVKSDSIELPIAHFSKTQRLFEIHVRLVGIATKTDGNAVFEGYSIVLGRDTTETSVQKQIAESFTNIPEILHHKFEHEAFRRRVLRETPHPITLKNTYILTGFSDISQSTEWRYEAMMSDEKHQSHEEIREVNRKTEEINAFLHSIWKEAKKRIEELHQAVFLLEETDGLDYSICFPAMTDKVCDHQLFLSLRREELGIITDIAKKCIQHDFPLKHLIVAHDKKVDFYFEEKFENRFKVETHSVDVFIKKKRVEKAFELDSEKRIIQEGCVTVVVDTDEDFSFYRDLCQEFQNKGVFSQVEIGNVEEFPGLKAMRFLRASMNK